MQGAAFERLARPLSDILGLENSEGACGMPAYYPDETGKLGEIYDLTKRKEKPNDPAATRASICACGEGDMRGGLAVGEPSERVHRAMAAYP